MSHPIHILKIKIIERQRATIALYTRNNVQDGIVRDPKCQVEAMLKVSRMLPRDKYSELPQNLRMYDMSHAETVQTLLSLNNQSG